MNFEVMEWAIGVLAILTTILIGWQIYTIFNIRKIQEEVEEKRKHVVWESERNMMVSASALSDFYYSIMINEPIEDVFFRHAYFKLCAILHASKMEDYAACDGIAQFLIETITDQSSVRVAQKKQLLDLMLKVKEPSKISNFQPLMKRIFDIKEF